MVTGRTKEMDTTISGSEEEATRTETPNIWSKEADFERFDSNHYGGNHGGRNWKYGDAGV